MQRSRAARGAILASLRWLALALFIVALGASRGWFEGESHVKCQRHRCRCRRIDLSGSFMRSEDFGEGLSRIKLAKEVLSKFTLDKSSPMTALVWWPSRKHKLISAAPLTPGRHDFLLHNLRARLDIRKKLSESSDRDWGLGPHGRAS